MGEIFWGFMEEYFEPVNSRERYNRGDADVCEMIILDNSSEFTEVSMLVCESL